MLATDISAKFFQSSKKCKARRTRKSAKRASWTTTASLERVVVVTVMKNLLAFLVIGALVGESLFLAGSNRLAAALTVDVSTLPKRAFTEEGSPP